MRSVILRLHLEPQPEGGYTVTSPNLPDLITEGETVEECISNGLSLAALLHETYIAEDIELPAIFRLDEQPVNAIDLEVEMGIG